MNVLFLTLSVSRKAGGLFFSVRSLAQQLQSANAQCRVLSPRDEFTDEDTKQWDPVWVDTFDVVGPKSLGYSKKISDLIGSPDIQHVHGIWMYHSLVNRRAAKRNNSPYLISPRGMLDPWAVKNARWKKKLVGWLYEYRHLREADCIHALCESEAKSIRDFGLKNPICIIPNAVDLPDLTIGRRSSPDHERKQLLFIGRIHPKKGLVNLIKAFGSLPNELRSGWDLVIAGWDQNHQGELESLASKMGISEHVSFPGPQFGQEKEALLRNCDAFVLPSFSEGLPMSVLEAWSYARPTLITNFCNLPEGPENGAAIECQANEPSIRAGLMDLFSRNTEDLETMGIRARELTERKFTWPVVSQEMLNVYRWLLGELPAPPNSVIF